MLYKCGYTTGVFDLFHVGHLSLLKQAKSCCLSLIVGVSSDELVLEVKKHLPVIPCDERMEIISAIKYVDLVVKQTTVDKLLDWQKYHFDAIFHGDDWKNSQIDLDNMRKLQDKSVDFIYFDRGHHISTTGIIKKIKMGQLNDKL